MFMQSLRASLVMFAAFTLLLGVAYPGVVTGLSSVLPPAKASGSLIISEEGKILGSTLIGQSFSQPEYFWGRLSATGPIPYNAAASSGSNLGVNADALKDSVQARLSALRQADPDNQSPVPVDLVTASASGIDPHISLEAAEFQARRVARERGMDIGEVEDMILQNTEGRQLGFLGERRVNVLKLNLALDGISKK